MTGIDLVPMRQMEDAEYPANLDLASELARQIRLLPLARMAECNEHMQALGPILQPTAYRDGGGRNLQAQRRLIDALLRVQRIADEVARGGAR